MVCEELDTGHVHEGRKVVQIAEQRKIRLILSAVHTTLPLEFYFQQAPRVLRCHNNRYTYTDSHTLRIY